MVDFKKLTLQSRIDHYNKKFPTYGSLFLDSSGEGLKKRYWIVGSWIIGNQYGNKGEYYYGKYPYGYLERILSLFPDIPEKNTLNLFCGTSNYGINFDIKQLPNVHIIGDAHNLSKELSNCDKRYCNFHLIFADPPYSQADAEHYGTPMIKRNIVVKECYKILEVGGYLVWLDQVYPMYSKKELLLVGLIGLVQSTNHRTRTIFIYQKQEYERKINT